MFDKLSKSLQSSKPSNELSPYNPTDMYGDVFTVLMARYENNLKTKMEYLKGQVEESKNTLSSFIQGIEKETRIMASAHCGESVFEIFKTNVTIPEDRHQDYSQYNAIQVSLEKGVVYVTYSYTLTVDNDAMYEVEKGNYKSREDYYYHNQALCQNRIKKCFPLDQDLVQQGLKLKATHVDLSKKLDEVQGLYLQLPSKERQLKAVIAQRKLESYGMSDLLNDPKLTSMVSFDDELVALVEVK